MKRIIPFLAFLTLLGCAPKPIPPVVIQVPDRKIDYLTEVKPVLDSRCVVCHSCYNSPCQLKLSSYEGLDRGASKEAIYNAGRLRTMDPSRLFVDASDTAEWREKGFHSVTKNSADEGENNSFMLLLVNHKMENPETKGEYYPEAGDLTCAKSHEELDEYLDKHPNKGMPFGFPPLTENEFQIVAGWLAQGASGPTEEEREKIVSINEDDLPEIVKWEGFLNMSSPKLQMTARYLYEHLFLAHINFSAGGDDFYELVRSRTRPGKPLSLIASVRPYDDPGVERVYYRFRKIHSTIVHKTHMVFELNDKKLLRMQELFIEPDWLQPPHMVGYDPQMSANPFAAFEQIPVAAKYKFLLDNNYYIIMTFIRGPVCKGQVALNVIHDHFWVMFMDPEFDLSVKYPGFLKTYKDKLRMPHEKESGFKLLKAVKNSYYKDASAFRKIRRDFYASHYFSGFDYNAIWRGEQVDDSPLLTVFRHFDSASVHRGVIGDLPRTMWVIDYPVMERIYYSLVAGFDVYGTAGHQLATRLYMDALRIDGESNFLDFLPRDQRTGIMQSWYDGYSFDKVHYPKPLMESAIVFSSDDPKREFIQNIIEKHLSPELNITFDRVNYRYDNNSYSEFPEEYKTKADVLQGLHAASKSGDSFFNHVRDHNANLAYIRVRNPNGEDVIVSAIINRWHDNVAFLFREKSSLDPYKDSADFVEGFVGSYPNYFFDVEMDEVAAFIGLIANFEDSSDYQIRLGGYGVNRAEPYFWEVYDWFQKEFNLKDPETAGLFDLNRYYYLAK